MTSTRHNGRSPISMVSFLSCVCSDQSETSADIRVPEYPMRVGLTKRLLWAPVWLLIKLSSSAKADDPVPRGPARRWGRSLVNTPLEPVIAVAGYDDRSPA